MNRLSKAPIAGRTERRLGFTLIELLVVVSIIALLIGILLPTLSEARRQAGIVACVATIRSNGQGAASYTADNRDRLPSAPEGDGNTNGPTTGERGIPAQNFANILDGGQNGFQFTASERETPAGITYHTIPQTQTSRGVGIEGFWFVAFGNYMVEGRGDAMLQEPFVSPTDRGRKSLWNAYRNTPRDQRDQVNYLRTATYFYVTPALYETRIFSKDGPFNPQGGQGQVPSALQRYRVFHRSSSVSFPSNKVAFYQHFATHDRGPTFWNQGGPGTSLPNGTATSIAMFDGSAKSVLPFRESQVFQVRDRDIDDTSTVRQMPAAFGPQTLGTGYTRNNQFFRFTFGGLSGRDLP